ncbi:MAG TPA: NAD-binding protein [Propionibacterium sp.]|jgi:phytoene dehydrogenase-like protein|nr:NAD-binding protein [Propionibacterium sp.]
MAAITVLGGTLSGMAVAARLAKAGHEVTLVHDGDRLGPAELPDVFTFPAPWRDLFTKSGRTLAAELARSGHELTSVAARPIGGGIELPAERGGQFAVLTASFGQRVAERWRDLLDDLDDVWQARRPLGLEHEFDRGRFRDQRRTLRWGTSVERLARDFDHPVLSDVIRRSAEADPRRSPADEAMWLAVERTFGLWQVTTTDGAPAGSRVLIDALTERLRTRKVEVTGRRPAYADAVVTAHGRIPTGWRGPQPWPRRTGSRVGQGAYTCGDHTHAGRTVAGQLLSAALAAYAVHLDLTGENIHPTNKDRRRSGR